MRKEIKNLSWTTYQAKSFSLLKVIIKKRKFGWTPPVKIFPSSQTSESSFSLILNPNEFIYVSKFIQIQDISTSTKSKFLKFVWIYLGLYEFDFDAYEESRPVIMC